MPAIPTIADAAKQIAAKQLSPVELTQACLARAKALDATLHAFLLLTEDRALADAKAAEARMMAGALRGKLDGIPIGHKDIYNTAGIRTTAHSRLLEHNVPTEDARVVQLWAEAGTVMLGKLATHEFAMGGPSFDLPWPPARNPWNPEHFTAGSSSGTGAAVASGHGAGRHRIGHRRLDPRPRRAVRAGRHQADLRPVFAAPACCRCPTRWTTPARWPGPSRTARCCCRRWPATTRTTPPAPTARRPTSPPASARACKGLRIGVVRHFFETDNKVNDATLKGIDDALEKFRAMGAEVRDVTLSPMADYHACGFLILVAEAYALHEPWLKSRFNDYGELFRDRIALGRLHPRRRLRRGAAQTPRAVPGD